MDYSALVADHKAIDRLVQQLLETVRAEEPRPVAAAHILETLAETVRDHLAVEDPIIYATVNATRGARHASTVEASVAELETLKEDWIGYLYRWEADSVTANWDGFAGETEELLSRLRDRVQRETAILYSLALHYEVIQPGC
jgi:hemerythrin-like domain-containing protein